MGFHSAVYKIPQRRPNTHHSYSNPRPTRQDKGDSVIYHTSKFNIRGEGQDKTRQDNPGWQNART